MSTYRKLYCGRKVKFKVLSSTDIIQENDLQLYFTAGTPAVEDIENLNDFRKVQPSTVGCQVSEYSSNRLFIRVL